MGERKEESSLAENTFPQERSGKIAVSASGNGAVPCSVRVTQRAADIVYGLTVAPANLEFVGRDAPAQQVTVTAQGAGLTWKRNRSRRASMRGTGWGEEVVAGPEDVVGGPGRFVPSRKRRKAGGEDGQERGGGRVVYNILSLHGRCEGGPRGRVLAGMAGPKS